MKTRIFYVRMLALYAGLSISSLAVAQSVPNGPYASWSDAQKQQAAGALKNMCNNQCSVYSDRASQGSMRATYEAAACTIACFVNNLPDDYPNIENLKQSANQNYSQAKSLGSDIPVFLRK